MDRSLIKLEEGPLITGYLGVELARVNTHGDIYPNVSCAYTRRHLSPFNLVRHHASSTTTINVKELGDKKRKRAERLGGETGPG